MSTTLQQVRTARRAARAMPMIGGLLALAVASACSGGGDSDEPSKLDHVTVAAISVPSGINAPFNYGHAEGIYKKHGIDLEFRYGKGTSLNMTSLEAGKLDFAVADGPTLIDAVASGSNIKAVMGWYQKYSGAIAGRVKSGVTEVADIEGKTVSVYQGESRKLLFEYFMKKAGIDASTVKVVQPQASAINALLASGKTQAAQVVGVSQLPILAGMNLDVKPFYYTDYGINIIDYSVLANKQLISDDPDLVKRFVTATVESLQAAMEHPEDAATAEFEMDPKVSRSPNEMLESVKAFREYAHTEASKDLPLGAFEESDWQETIDTLVAAGIIDKSKAKDPSTYYTNKFIPN